MLVLMAEGVIGAALVVAGIHHVALYASVTAVMATTFVGMFVLSRRLDSRRANSEQSGSFDPGT